MIENEKEIYSIYRDWLKNKMDFLTQVILISVIGSMSIISISSVVIFILLLAVVALYSLVFIMDTYTYMDIIVQFQEGEDETAVKVLDRIIKRRVYFFWIFVSIEVLLWLTIKFIYNLPNWLYWLVFFCVIVGCEIVYEIYTIRGDKKYKKLK